MNPNADGPDAKKNAATALAAFLLLAALACLSIWLVQPPRAVPEDAPPAAFSSGRALRHLRQIAQRPHPTGSDEIGRVRQYVLGELGALGVNPEVQATEVVLRQRGAGLPTPAGRVQNIVARVPGSANSRALMLAAHYDSVPTAPGASDDGAGVAALLETLRALKTGAPLKNDLILLFTDAEELGLVGAHAFADEHPWMKDVGLVLNFEGRGAGGPSMMFETSAGNGRLVGEMARAAPHVVANSLMYAVYERLPNDTDMTVFKRAGAAGLNFAYAERLTHYHTMLDSAEQLDERSLQHHGSYALALARRFGDSDLRDVRARDAVYFNAFGPLFVRYSERWVVPVTILVVILFAAVLFVGWRGNQLTLRGLAAGFLTFFVAAAGAGAAATLLWRAARRIYPGYTFLPWRTPYQLWPFEVGFVLLAFAAAAAVYAHLFRKTGAANLLLGALLWWLILLLATTTYLPLGSFLFAWPLLFTLAGCAFIFVSRRQTFTSGKSLALLAACAAPGVAIIAPLLYMFFMMLGVELVGFFMLLLVLLLGLLVPHLRVLAARGRRLVPLAVASVGVGLIVFGIVSAGFDAQRRKTNSVFYFLDADAGRALWVSTDAVLDEWTSQFIPPGAQRESVAQIFPWLRQQAWQGGAENLALPAPEVELLDDRTEGEVRAVRLRVRSPRGAPMLLVNSEPGTEIRRALLNGKTVIEGEPDAQGRQINVLRVSYAAPPPEGFELLIETRAAGPLRLIVQDVSFGLPEIPGKAFRARSEDMMPVPSYRASDTTLVRRTFDIEDAVR